MMLLALALQYAAQASAKAPQDLRERLHESLGKIFSTYQSARTLSVEARHAQLAPIAKEHHITLKDESVIVIVYLTDTSKKSIDRIVRANHIPKDISFGRLGELLQVRVPIKNLETLARDRAVRWVEPPQRGHVQTVDEGVAKTYADLFHQHVPPYTGAGVKVAIIDLGFSGYESFLGTALPDSVTINSLTGDITGGGEIHGAACAEVVHSMAPDAQLFLINVGSVIDLNNAVQYCLAQGVKVISHSVVWFNQSFYDGTGPVCAVADSAVAHGIIWVNGAGNSALAHWGGKFYDPDYNQYLNFSDTDEAINTYGSDNQLLEFFLTWNEWPKAHSDFDMFLTYDDSVAGTIQVAASRNPQSGTQPPTEAIEYTVPQGKSGTYHVGIIKKSGDTLARLCLFTSPNYFSDYNVTANSILDPASATSVLCVGATNVNTDEIENFSSQGPTNDGRKKPDLCAPDGTANATYGYFFGTSCATPHAAGAAALLLSQDPTRTVAQLKQILMQDCRDLGAPGYDSVFGNGLIRLPDIFPPTFTRLGLAGGSVWTNSKNVSAMWQATDAWTGVKGYAYLWNHSATATIDTINLSTATSDSTTIDSLQQWYFHIRAVDSVGNASDVNTLGPIMFDVTPPVGTVSIDSAADTIHTLTVTLTINASDAQSGVAQMQFSNNGTTWSALEPYQQQRTAWNMHFTGGSGNAGLKVVYCRVVDSAGNISNIFSDSRIYTPPTIAVREPLTVAHSPAIAIYPQPARSMLSAATEMSGTLHASVTDMMGRVVIEKIQPGESRLVQLSLHSLHSGLYALRITNGQQISTAPFIVVQ